MSSIDEEVRAGIPDFQTLMLPVLVDAAQGEVRIGVTIERMARLFKLSPAQLADMLPSGRANTFANRVHWAKFYLGKAGLVKLTRRGHFEITERGKATLAEGPARIDLPYLKRFPEYNAFRSAEHETTAVSSDVDLPTSSLTPDEEMRAARDRIDAALASDILARIVDAPPEFFERLIVNLLTSMGYGGSVSEAGRALGRSGDGGVDGVVDGDALGLDRVYVQAKRYKEGNTVGPGAIRDFFGALDQFKAGKGLFVTTSSFSRSAIQTAEGLSKRIVLIDGPHLTRLMIRYEVGCRVEETLYIKKLDEEFFDV